MPSVHRHFLPPLVALSAATVWILLALRRPDVTYHLGPPIAAAAWPLLRRSSGGQLPIRRAAAPTLGGLFLACTATIALHLADALRGAALVGGNALNESLLFATVGAAWGLWTLTRPHAGWLVRLIADDPP